MTSMKRARGLHGPVLAAIDLTDASDAVLGQAHALAASLDARLTISHVLYEKLQARLFLAKLLKEDAAGPTDLEQQALQAMTARTLAVTGREAGDFDVAVDWGSPHAGILSRAERMHAGVVVVGAGSVAERVARYAPCEVLVARPSARGSVLGATDFSDPSLPAIEMAIAEATRRGVPLRLLHCLEFAETVVLGPPSVGAGVLPPLQGDAVDRIARGERERLQDSLARFAAHGECLVSRGLAAVAIVNAAHAAPTELVVVGMRGRSNVSRLLLGSVAETVLRMSPCSVLIVHVTRHLK